ncbi:hypothetical protein GCM10020331_089690 [Ectobacillus funiculus]
MRKKAQEGKQYGLTEQEARKFAASYGSNVDILFSLAQQHKEESIRLNMPVTVLLPLIYAMEYEMATTPVDFFIRRTGALFFSESIGSAHGRSLL